MTRKRLIGLLLLLAVAGACNPEKAILERLNSADWRERERAVYDLGAFSNRAGAMRTLEGVLRHDPDKRVRFNAAIALGKLGGREATAVLVEIAASTDERSVRVAALDAIETTRDPAAVPGLVNLFRLNRSHDDRIVHIGASNALEKIGPSGVPQLLQALKDPSPKVREAVLRVLGSVGPPDIAEQIAALRADPDHGVRSAVEGALFELSKKPVPATP